MIFDGAPLLLGFAVRSYRAVFYRDKGCCYFSLLRRLQQSSGLPVQWSFWHFQYHIVIMPLAVHGVLLLLHVFLGLSCSAAALGNQDPVVQSSVHQFNESKLSWFENAAKQLDFAFPVVTNLTNLPHSWPAFKFNWRILTGSFIAFVGATLANSAGVGGGGLFVPMFRLLIGFDVKTSAALSKSMIMGGAVASALYNLQLKHPVLDKPLIDYDLALLIQPMLLLGISIGVMCNVMFPDWILTVLLIFVLIGMAYKSFKKGVCTWKEETERVYRKEEDLHFDKDTIHKVHDCDTSSCSKQYNHTDASSSLEQGLLAEAQSSNNAFSWQLIKWTNIAFLCLVWTLYLTVQLLKARSETCGKMYWVLNACQIPISVLATAVGTWRLSRRQNIVGKLVAGSGWSFQQMLLYPLGAVLAGTVGGLLGIGGGMVLAPLFLELGIIPQVTSATTTFIVVFSSSMSVVEFYLLGRLPLNFAGYFTILCALSAVIGLHSTKLFILKYGRASFIIFILAFIIGASAIVLGIIGGFSDIQKYLAGEYMGFHSLCRV